MNECAFENRRASRVLERRDRNQMMKKKRGRCLFVLEHPEADGGVVDDTEDAFSKRFAEISSMESVLCVGHD